MLRSLNQIIEYLAVVFPTEDGESDTPWTFREIRTLKCIMARGPQSMSALAATLRVSLPTMTHIIDRLIEKEAVVRFRPEHDRRIVSVALSSRSKHSEQQFFDKQSALVAQIIQPLGPAEREQTVRIFGEIERLAQSYATIHERPKAQRAGRRSVRC
jgi:DNA-binding MarR family transcriptional regulator